MNVSIGKNIKKIRKERKLKQEELAKQIGISRSYLSDIENNRKNPSIKTIESLADKLNVTVFYLTTGKKMMADLSDSELREVGKEAGAFFRKNKENSQEYIKNEIENLLSGELNFTETMYLTNALNFLSSSNEEELIFLTAFIRSLNHKDHNAPEDDSVTQEEIKEFIDTTIEETREFLEKYFGYGDDK